MATARNVTKMAFFNRCGHDRSAEWLLSFRRQVGDGREAASTGLYGTRLRGAARKHGKTIENGVCGLANHNIDIS